MLQHIYDKLRYGFLSSFVAQKNTQFTQTN